MKLVLASNNLGKLGELHPLFAPLGYTLISQSALGTPEADEPHCTFVENALAKARNAARHTGLPALADDAGLCVNAFGGLPGVDTAHYAAQFGQPQGDGVRLLLEQLLPHADRRAALVSTLVAVRHPADPEPLIAVGRASGLVALVPAGEGGFGFDPVLYIADMGCTFAQMSAGDKNRLSHRGQAARQMIALMRSAWGAD